MNIETRKKLVVSEFLKLNNEKSIKEVQELVDKLKVEDYEKNLEPMSLEKFYSEIDEGLEDEKNGRLINARKLKEEIKKWI